MFGIALLVFALLGAIGSASARHRSHADAGAPGDFAYYVRRAYTSIAIPQELSGLGQAIERPPAAIAAAFLHANPHLPAQSIAVTCSGQGAPRLREVHICLDRDLMPRACSADAMRGSCRAPQVIIPPVR
jgi:ribonuclease T2